MKNIFLTIFLSLMTFFLSDAQQQDISFTYFGLEDGLSQLTVFDIAEDGKGNMWFATYNGLNRFDGYRFTAYHHNPKDSSSLGGDMIR